MITAILMVVAGGAIAGVIGLAVRTARRAAAERTALIRAAAAPLGWSFRAEVPFKTIPDLDRFELFGMGGSRKLTNVMTSPAGDPRAVVFDYSYTISTGKSSHTYRQTVFYATSDALSLPTFSLRPEHFFHRIATAFGYQDIDLERHPTFSEAFLLRGKDEAAVRAKFTGAVAEFFEAHPGVCAAGRGRELLYWQPNVLAGPEGIEPLIAAGFELARLFA